MNFVCPKDKKILEKKDSGYYCSVCNLSYKIVNNIPIFFDSDFYWGEIPKEAMVKVLAVIKDKSYLAGIEYLEEKFPGRLKFVFDISRSDWRFPIDIKPGMKVLDLGCGWGTHSFPLADLGAEVYSVDITKERIYFVEARRQYENKENVHPLVGNVMELPFEENSFDMISSNGVLEWVGLQQEFGGPVEVQEKFITYMRKLLKPNGVLYIGIENRIASAYFSKGVDHSGLRYTSLMPRFLANIYTKLRLKKPYITYTYTHKGYQKLFKKCGFTNIDTYIPFPGYNNPQSLVPHNSLVALKFFLSGRGKFKKIKSPFLRAIIFNPLFIRIYRYMSYSFDFYLKK